MSEGTERSEVMLMYRCTMEKGMSRHSDFTTGHIQRLDRKKVTKKEKEKRVLNTRGVNRMVHYDTIRYDIDSHSQ